LSARSICAVSSSAPPCTTSALRRALLLGAEEVVAALAHEQVPLLAPDEEVAVGPALEAHGEALGADGVDGVAPSAALRLDEPDLDSGHVGVRVGVEVDPRADGRAAEIHEVLHPPASSTAVPRTVIRSPTPPVFMLTSMAERWPAGSTVAPGPQHAAGQVDLELVRGGGRPRDHG